MSRYNEKPPIYIKEDLYNYIKNFIENYPLSELMTILTDIIESIEWEKAENERFNQTNER